MHPQGVRVGKCTSPAFCAPTRGEKKGKDSSCRLTNTSNRGQTASLRTPPGEDAHTQAMACPWRHLERCVHLNADKSPGRQAKPQLLAVWWLLKEITAPGLRPRSSTNDLAPPRRMGWVFLQPYPTCRVVVWERAALPWLCHRGRRRRSTREYRCLPRRRR